MRLKKRVRDAIAVMAAAALVGGLVFSILTYAALRQAQEETLRLRGELDGLYAGIAGVSEESGLSAAALERSLAALRERIDAYLARPDGSAAETPAATDISVPPPAEAPAAGPAAGRAGGKTGPSESVDLDGTDIPLAAAEPDPAAENGAGGPENDAPETPAMVQAGDKVVLTVAAEQEPDLYGYQFQLHYDDTSFRYDGGLESLTPGLDTIFGKEFDGYLLVGATMVGQKKGAALEDAPVCRVTLTALRDTTWESVAVDAVHVVGSDLKYTENVRGWTVTSARLQR
ncbi:MAG: cohesin domain-containing protein [Oscillospiraceae bacterium]|jgi:hypothetical protein|nr:cohesin domain-containing protein [Oscillospiraceae bacterium]